MKASELRIGNWVKIINQNGIIKDFDAQIECADITRIFDQCFNVWNYEPIPLTEEWLLKFGIKQYIHDKKRFYLLGVELYIFNENKIIFNPASSVLSLKLQHVHQLQNLYFALTGKELTLKLEI